MFVNSMQDDDDDEAAPIPAPTPAAALAAAAARPALVCLSDAALAEPAVQPHVPHSPRRCRPCRITRQACPAHPPHARARARARAHARRPASTLTSACARPSTLTYPCAPDTRPGTRRGPPGTRRRARACRHRRRACACGHTRVAARIAASSVNGEALPPVMYYGCL